MIGRKVFDFLPPRPMRGSGAYPICASRRTLAFHENRIFTYAENRGAGRACKIALLTEVLGRVILLFEEIIDLAEIPQGVLDGIEIYRAEA